MPEDTDSPQFTAVADDTLPNRFEREVARRPDTVAVSDDRQELTYRELNARANRLARRLLGQGAGPDVLVGILLPRGCTAITAILAVLKTGAAYVPLDPNYPQTRLSHMIGDARPICVIAQQGSWKTNDVPVVVDPSEEPTASAADVANIRDGERIAPLKPNHLAYVIYTSGSTGQPKGVMIEHRSLLHYVAWAAVSYPGARTSTLLHSSLSFDLTVTALYLPLLHGGRVHIADLADYAATRMVLERIPLGFLKVTPGHLHVLSLLPPQFHPAEQLVVGGEQLTGGMLRRLRRQMPRVTVFNEYGPTEATVGCMEYRVGPGQRLSDGPVPIGVAAPGVRIHVLDDALQVTPPGEEGEIFIAGAGVARGYWSRPAPTAERFLPDPFGPAGSRMYRTGDRARRGVDGTLEFLGRMDDQIKVNGFRIEPGEIESVLSAHPGVAQVTVVAISGRPGISRLVAYIVADDENVKPAPTALRARAASALPGYMVPAAFLLLDALPLTPHGKLDRAALPRPDFRNHPEISGVPLPSGCAHEPCAVAQPDDDG
ncbi:non-ribosomal peptide synthetase [Mangrovihabitans endophyticus]|uniref:Amino acid adenylation domain-containing protein n=1 Tax=Mangrovihabitans endophyticus TaxID=1751298 RepID=A0A8J3BUK6_9ACTN|nr:amino acid adenylation domain-containing protein [Mangrovihabitans endophyticus]GGK79717.1 hypothetical protein GCM10012284_12160 [Mangrovihabitans endophyticus]